MASGLVCNHPEQVQAVGVTGIDRQKLPEEPLGFV
jgi:hypothetical protein